MGEGLKRARDFALATQREVICDYCRRPAEFVTGREIYPHIAELAEKRFWLCRPCGAYVGCHPGGVNPLGRLADKVLRKAKIDAHTAFDGYWKPLGVTRSAAYKWLAEKLGVDPKRCHIGMFDVDECRRVVEVVNTQLAKRQVTL